MENLPKGLASSNAGRIALKLGAVSAGKVLDVGTGSGGFISTLIKSLRAYDSFVGIDYYPSEESKRDMESARKQFEGKPVQFLEMNAENLQFEDEPFDTVSISWSLHHLANMDKVMAEMKRVLRKGGNFILQEMYCDGEQTEAQKTHELKHEWEARIDSLLGITHNRTLTRQQIRDIAYGLALSDIEIFDSTHLVNCLSCERKHECEDPRNQATFHEAAKDVDNVIKRIENYPDLETRRQLVEEGERIKAAITVSGSSPASYLFAIGKK